MKPSSFIHRPQAAPEKGLIRYIWKVKRTGCSSEKEKILPKGTAEIIFNLSEKTLCFKDTEQQHFQFYKCSINGLNTTPYHLVKGGTQTFIGIQLQVYALKFLFGMPGKEFTDRVYDGFDVCPSLSVLFEKLSEAHSFDEEVELILSWFRKRLADHLISQDRLLLFDLHTYGNADELSVRSICHRYNLSSRHLRRLSDEYLGINAEDFILYRKYLRALTATHAAERSLTDVALEGGFYDQSHFIRTFKTFTGITPGSYRKNRSDLVGHLYFDGQGMSV